MRRWFAAPAGLLAGAVLALTPVAALMFRFNNPDALLTLLLVRRRVRHGAGARARRARGGCVLAGALVGFAFLAKMLQAFLVRAGVRPGVPDGRADAAAAAALWQLLAGAASRWSSPAGWWVAVVELWPAVVAPVHRRLATTTSVLELIFGYNGFGRLTGERDRQRRRRRRAASAAGAAGSARLFNAEMGGQISWLLPVAAVALVAGIWSRRGAPRTDRRRAASSCGAAGP